MMTTLVHRHPEQYLHTFVMADILYDDGEQTLRFFSGFS